MRTALRRTGAAAGLLALLIVIPALLLLIVGVPTGLPSVHDLWLRLSTPDDGTVLIAATSIVAWIAWAIFAASVVVEVLAAVRGVRAPQLRWAGPVQALAAVLVTAVGLGVAPPAGVGPPRAVAAAPAAVSWVSHEPAVHTPAQTPVPTANTHPEIVVQRGDTLWSLAEQHLHDPLRFTEIAQLNYGRVQADGRTLTDAHWIYPGWKLQLPAVAKALKTPPVVAPPAAPKAPAPIVATSAAPTSPPAPIPPAGAASEARPAHAPAQAKAAQETAEAEQAAPFLAYAGMGLLATGLLAELVRRRRRHRGRHPFSPAAITLDPEVSRTELELRARADAIGVTALRHVLRHLSTVDGESGRSVLEDLVMVQLDIHALTLHFSQAQCEAPEPWTIAETGRAWSLDRRGRATLLDTEPTSRVDVVPGLVTAGATSDGAHVLINLHALGRVDLHGSPEDLWCQLDTFALELATSPWDGQWGDVMTVGLPSVNEFERVTRLLTVADAVSELEVRAASLQLALEEHGVKSPLQAHRLGIDDDRLTPTTVILATAPTADERLGLHAAWARFAGGCAVVIPTHDGVPDFSSPGATLTIVDRQTTDVVCTDPEGSVFITERLQTAYLDRAERASIDAMFATADHPAPALVEDQSLLPELVTLESADDEAVGLNVPQPPPEVIDLTDEGHSRAAEGLTVRVLGPVDVLGLDQPLSTPRLQELLLLVALRGEDGLSVGLAMQALSAGPDASITASYRSRLASQLRRELGPASDGGPRLLTSRGRYWLHPDVKLDWQTFLDQAAEGTSASLGQALSLIRGEPLDGVDYWWLPEHGVAENRIRDAVITASERLALMQLDAGNYEAAAGAASAGLRMGTDERLYRCLMRAHHELGNRAGVEHAWRSCLAGLSELDLFEAHPETTALYAELMGKEPVA